jgi:hypothetical protein
VQLPWRTEVKTATEATQRHNFVPEGWRALLNICGGKRYLVLWREGWLALLNICGGERYIVLRQVTLKDNEMQDIAEPVLLLCI